MASFTGCPTPLSYEAVVKVVRERKMGTATNSPPVMALEEKHVT